MQGRLDTEMGGHTPSSLGLTAASRDCCRVSVRLSDMCGVDVAVGVAGFNCEAVTYKNTTFTIWDGQAPRHT